MLIVQVCDFGNDGDARYRAHDPARELGKLPGVTAIDCHFLSRRLPELTRQADILLLHFINDWDFLELVLRRKAMGKITVFEANDYYPDIQPWNSQARNWADGTLAELLRLFLTLADGVQTSTPELARRWREFGAPDVAVFPNQLTRVPDLLPAVDRPLTIGWGGSPGHLADWLDVAPALQRWLEKNADVKLAVMCAEPARDFIRLPPKRYEFKANGSLEDYLTFLRGIDIGLAPLLPTEFNRCRSDVKFLEYASQGVPGVYADLEPYRESVVGGETGLLYNSHEELIDNIDRLRAEPSLRSNLRRAAHDEVKQNRLLPANIGHRLSWYQSLVERCGSMSQGASSTGRSAAQGYVELRAEEPEHALRVALHAPSADEAVSRLAPLTAAYPAYHLALLHHGALLNNLRQYREALSILTRAAELESDRARAYSELGRAWFHLGDAARAKEAMEQALRVNPYHLPAWQYLLRLLAATTSPDATEWSRKAREIFPDCRSIALLAAATLPKQQMPAEVLSCLERFVPRLRDFQRPPALADFARVIRTAAEADPAGETARAMLVRASELFPEARLVTDTRPILWQLSDYIRTVRGGC